MNISKQTAIIWLLCGVLGFVGLIAADYAKSKFWWTFWDVVAWVGFLAFIAGIVYVAIVGTNKRTS